MNINSELLISELTQKLNRGLIEPHSPALESQVREVVMEHVKAESSGEPFLTYGNLRMLNLPYAKPVYDEVLIEDCYRKDKIPEKCTVIDVGAFCGEFGLWCAANKDCRVVMIEPSLNHHIISYNRELNSKLFKQPVFIIHGSVGGRDEPRAFSYNFSTPAASMLGETGNSVVTDCRTLSHVLRLTASIRPICIKLDCEGAEREIFDDETWLDQNVYLVLMEFHNKDGQRYREILTRHGFKVEMSDENPEAVRATIYATKI